MSYHNDMISVILSNKEGLEWELMMYDISIMSEVGFDRGDFDLFVRGYNIFDGKDAVAIVEVKGHQGLVPHYIRKQLPKYKKQFPEAKQFVVYGTPEKSLYFENFTFLNSDK